MLIPAQPQYAWQEPQPSLERRIGAMVADAACLLTQALLEYRDGELHPATKMLGGYLIASTGSSCCESAMTT